MQGNSAHLVRGKFCAFDIKLILRNNVWIASYASLICNKFYSRLPNVMRI
jgi:hypothetical protein